MKIFNSGDTLYIPAHTLLFLIEDNNRMRRFNKFKKTKKPSYLMYLRENKIDNKYLDVFYDGNVWSVHCENAYERGEE